MRKGKGRPDITEVMFYPGYPSGSGGGGGGWQRVQYNNRVQIRYERIHRTGRQLPPLSSGLYGIISGRRSVLAA